MKLAATLAVIAVVLGAIACQSKQAQLVATAGPTATATTAPSPLPTPDLEATIEAAIEATTAAKPRPSTTAAASPTPPPTAVSPPPTLDLEATIAAAVEATTAAKPRPSTTATASPSPPPTAVSPPTPTMTPRPTPIPEPSPTPKTEAKTFNVGDTVRLGDLEITVNGVRASSGNDFWVPSEGNHFVYVDVTFKNNGDQPEALRTLLQMQLQDTQGFQYSLDFTAIAASDVSTPDGEIAPGGLVRGEVGYQLPTSASGLTWRFSGDIFRLGQATFALGVIAVPTPSPVPTPTPIPVGFSLDNPVAAGEVLTGSDSTKIRVIGIVSDARQQVAEENRFNDPPAEGMRFYMVSIEVASPPSADPITVSRFDFGLIGDNRVVYTTKNRCGVIPDPLRGEIFGGGRLQGNICFEIPEDEGGLILIHEPGFAAESRRFLGLTS